jgi:glycosyltransferase involved in cell wall biosynthesis
MFIGSSNPINVQAARYFIDEILPPILKARPDFRLHLVGDVCSGVEDAPALVKHGRLEALGDAFAVAPLAINPVLSGTGLNIKLIDSLAHGAPMITTETGARGLPGDLRTAVAVIPDEKPQAFAEAVLALLADPALRRRMAEQARAAASGWNRRQQEALVDCLSPASPGPIAGGRP